MTATLSYMEVINSKKAVERAINKLLQELEKQTGKEVLEISLVKVIGRTTGETLSTSVNINIDL